MTAQTHRPPDTTDPPARTAPRRLVAVAVVVIALAALGARAVFSGYRSGDYVGFYLQWYEFIRQHGGFAALRYNFANYNVPYLYLLAAVSYLPLPPLIAVKLIPVVFDAVLAYFTWRLVAIRYSSVWPPIVAAGIVVLLPTVVLNGSMWAQSDATYVAPTVAAVYYLVRRRPWLACLLLGIAFAFKQQTVFIFPAILLLALRRWIPWRALLAIPAVYLVLDVPAALLGARWSDLLLVYVHQVTLKDDFTFTAPNMYRYLNLTGSSGPALFVGIAVTGVVLLALIGFAGLRRVELTGTRVVLVVVVCVLLVPFLLPKIQERYFMLADVLTLVAAFWLPRRLWYAPVLTQFASLFAYLPFLLLPYRLRDLTGDPTIANSSGFTSARGLLKFATSPPEVSHALLGPVVDFRILSTAILIALVGVSATTVREFRGAARQEDHDQTWETTDVPEPPAP